MAKELREYQRNIVNDVLESTKDVVVCLPTGSGKTVIASALIEELQGKVIFVVPRLELIKQASEEFGDVDIIWADKTSLDGKHCIIASKESLRRQYGGLPQELKDELHEGTVIFDEVHVSLEQSYKIVQMIEPKRVIGLTATPERMDGQALLKGTGSTHKYGLFDDVLQRETVPSLIRKGFLCPLRYYARPIEGISDIRPDNPTADELSGSQMVKIFNENNIWGDLVHSYEEYGKGRPALGFTTTVAMGEEVVQIFQDAGYDFRLIHGEMSVKERQGLIDALRNKEIDGLVNAALLTYGFDCPPVSYAFNCRHIKSRPLWFQVVGRILRPCEGKEDAIFVDHADSISEFSEPDCSLPILDETIVWRANGETKEEKQLRRRARKKVQETMELISELDPMPAKLVEITVENTWERLVEIIKRLRKENALLEEKNNSLQMKNESMREHVSALARKRAELEQTAIDTATRNLELKRAIQDEHKKRIELQEENKRIKQETQRYVDPDKTFNYIKSHYIRYRMQIEQAHAVDRATAHKMVRDKMEAEEQFLPFLFDDYTFDRGMRYWFENYEKRLSAQRGA